MAKSLDLDVDSPEKVALVLQHAANEFYDSANELQSAWQTKEQSVWHKIAAILEKAANQVNTTVQKYG